MGEPSLISNDGLHVPDRSLPIAEYGDCKATFAREICTWQAHRGRGSVWAFRAQTRVPQSASRGAHIANELAETVGCRARPDRAHFSSCRSLFIIELCLERFFVLAIRVAVWLILVVPLVQGAGKP